MWGADIMKSPGAEQVVTESTRHAPEDHVAYDFEHALSSKFHASLVSQP